MTHTRIWPVVATTTAFLGIVVMLSVDGAAVRAQSNDCIGKPYGYPGCPMLEQSAVSSSAVPAHCGDGVLQKDEGETCDEGRMNGQGACTSSCVLLYCGDGKISVQAGEECEPKVEQVYAQDPQTGEMKVQKRFVAQSCGTYCTAPAYDAQGKTSGGCRKNFQAACTVSSVSSSTGSAKPAAGSSVSSASAGSVSSVAAVSSPASSASSQSSAPIVLSSLASSSLPVIPAAACGDGIRQSPEECDDGNQNPSDLCSNTCRLPACGDGIRQANEECDDGNRSNADACSNVCTVLRCGDGIVNAGEECDDGNQLNTDACSNSCRFAHCGDGIIQANEECDDGNHDNTDACSNTCHVPRCGNGMVEGAEQCDNGLRNSNMSKNACRLNCRQPVCGDKVIDSGEECDGGAYCTGTCTLTAPVATVAVKTPPATTDKNSIVLQAIVGSLIIVTGILGYLLRTKILILLGLKKPVKDMDDLPLDQIEAPWNKW
ncbi:MAG: hypothetical protein JWM56_1366 [Candidatus Peribacteria bacterium]|nr:hypothetical protein [Candidatus Peribacteria bacterium]